MLRLWSADQRGSTRRECCPVLCYWCSPRWANARRWCACGQRASAAGADIALHVVHAAARQAEDDGVSALVVLFERVQATMMPHPVADAVVVVLSLVSGRERVFLAIVTTDDDHIFQVAYRVPTVVFITFRFRLPCFPRRWVADFGCFYTRGRSARPPAKRCRTAGSTWYPSCCRVSE